MMSEFWDLLVESHWIAVQFVSRTCQPPKDDTDTESDERRPQCEETTCVFRLKWIKRRKDTNTLCYDINSRLPTSEESLVLLPALSTASKFVRFVRRLSTDFWGVLDWSSWTKSALIQTFSCSNQQKMQLYVLSITSNFSEHKKKKKHLQIPFMFLWNTLMLFEVSQKTGRCLFTAYKPGDERISSFYGIIIAFQRARETSLKPIISHMEKGYRPDWLKREMRYWMAAKSSRR